MKGSLKRAAAVLLMIAVIFSFTPFVNAQNAYGADKTPVGVVTLSCPVPQAGTAITVPRGETSQYTYTAEWFYDDGSSDEWQPAGGTYQRGLDYAVRFIVSPTSGYTLYDSPDLVVAVNGDTDVEKSFMALGSTEYMFVYYRFHVDGTLYSVTFDANGGGGYMNGFYAEENNYCKLPPCGFTAPAEKYFAGWIVGGQTKQPEEKIKITENTVIRAKWNDVTRYTVTFDNQGIGSKPADQSVAENGYATEPVMEDFGRWHFAGWYKDPALTEPWNFSGDKVTANTTLYAAWGYDLHRIFLFTDVPEIGKAFTEESGSGDGFTFTKKWCYDAEGNQPAVSPFESGKDYYAVFTVRLRPGFSIDPDNYMALVNDDNHVFVKDSFPYDELLVSYRYHFLSEDDISLPEGSFVYTGSALEPKPIVKDGDVTLTEGVDYTLAYENNVNAGTASVTVTGSRGNVGTVTKTFRIAPKAVTPAVTLSKKAFTYNGKVQTPTVTVKAGTKKLENKKDYTIRYSPTGRTNVGSYKVIVTLKGNYKGTKTVTYKINPKGTTLKTPAAASKAVTVKWNKQSAKMKTPYITGYQIQLATDSKFTKNKKTVTVPGYSKVSKKVTGLKGGKKYYVKIRTYKTVSGVKYYSPWSKVKTVTTKR